MNNYVGFDHTFDFFTDDSLTVIKSLADVVIRVESEIQGAVAEIEGLREGVVVHLLRAGRSHRGERGAHHVPAGGDEGEAVLHLLRGTQLGAPEICERVRQG